MIDPDLHLARALLVDGNALLRSTTTAQLRDIGVGQVVPASRVRDARLLLERETFDIVLCNLEFEGSDDSGQDLLDELRRERLLPHSTVFVMITARASYHQVVEAAEASLDAILVRPYTADALAQRLLEARQRKRELADIVKALDAGEAEAALARSLRRFGDRAPYWSYCGRLAAELLLAMNRPTDAKTVFEKLAAAKPSTWARLGIARAQFALGDMSAARRTAQSVLKLDPGCADAHDLVGRVLVEQCDFDAALEEYRTASAITPGCLLRQQHVGALAFYQAQGDEALKHFEHAIALGVRSNLFDALTLLLAAVLHYDRSDAEHVRIMREQLRRFHERFPQSQRLARLARAAHALHDALLKGPAAARPALLELATEADGDAFDLEGATVLLALSQRLLAAFDGPAEYETLVKRIGMRFAVSRPLTEVLVAAAARSHPATGLLRGCHTEIAAWAEQAMNRALQGDPQTAVRNLLEWGGQTRNVRLVELARLLARRHHDAIADAAELAGQAQALLQCIGHAGNHVAGIQRSGRAPGAMQLRGLSGRQQPQVSPPPEPFTATAPTTSQAAAAEAVTGFATLAGGASAILEDG